MGAEAETQSPVVYFGGINLNGNKRAWYRVDVDSLQKTTMETEVEGKAVGYTLRKCKRRRTTLPSKPFGRSRSVYRWVSIKSPNKKIPRVRLYSAAELKGSCFSGSCSIVVDEELYCFGQTRLTGSSTMLLAKYHIKKGTNDDPLSWEILYSSPKFSSHNSSVVPVGKKLFVLCGIDVEFDLCGAIYDLERKTWENLKSDIYTCRLIDGYRAPHLAISENKTEVLFYSLFKGSVLFFDITSRKRVREEVHSSLALWNGDVCTCPQGLDMEACGGFGDLICGGFGDLISATNKGPACLNNNTLYWFTSELRLYGYDLKLQKWFHSPSLWKQFPTLSRVRPLLPSLVVLPNGKFLVIVFEGRGEVTVAPLKVSRKEDYLMVTVESCHPFSLGVTSFFPLTTMSTVKG